MYESEIIEYINRHKMEETTAKVLTRLHYMKTILYRTIKKTSCGIISNPNTTRSSTKLCQLDKRFESTVIPSVDYTSDDTISSISDDSTDSGVSTLSSFSHYLLPSSTLLLHQTTPIPPKISHLRCNPSVINSLSHNLLTTRHSELFFDDIDDQNFDETLFTQMPLADSSRRNLHEAEHTTDADVDDNNEQTGPLTSTLIDRWYSVTKPYMATFHQDLTVRKNELVQVLRSTHPHWVWIRNEHCHEGYIPTDCLLIS